MAIDIRPVPVDPTTVADSKTETPATATPVQEKSDPCGPPLPNAAAMGAVSGGMPPQGALPAPPQKGDAGNLVNDLLGKTNIMSRAVRDSSQGDPSQPFKPREYVQAIVDGLQAGSGMSDREILAAAPLVEAFVAGPHGLLDIWWNPQADVKWVPNPEAAVAIISEIHSRHAASAAVGEPVSEYTAAAELAEAVSLYVGAVFSEAEAAQNWAERFSSAHEQLVAAAAEPESRHSYSDLAYGLARLLGVEWGDATIEGRPKELMKRARESLAELSALPVATTPASLAQAYLDVRNVFLDNLPDARAYLIDSLKELPPGVAADPRQEAAYIRGVALIAAGVAKPPPGWEKPVEPALLAQTAGEVLTETRAAIAHVGGNPAELGTDLLRVAGTWRVLRAKGASADRATLVDLAQAYQNGMRVDPSDVGKISSALWDWKGGRRPYPSPTELKELGLESTDGSDPMDLFLRLFSFEQGRTAHFE